MTLTLTSWNLKGSMGVDTAAVARQLHRAGADVVLLQEVQRRQAHRLARALGARSWHWSFKHQPFTVPAEGMAVIGVNRIAAPVRAQAITRPRQWLHWRRRIVQVATLDNLDGWARPASSDDLASSPGVNSSGDPAGPVRLVNVHLTPHGDGAAEREREVAVLLDVVSSFQGPVVVAGDLNAEPGTGPDRQLRAAGLSTRLTTATKWRGEPSDRPPERLIDHIWCRGGLSLTDAWVPRPAEEGFATLPRLSDHLPVTARLDIAARPAGGA